MIFKGFGSENLFPTDRTAWTDINGKAKTKNIYPAKGWKWKTEWKVRVGPETDKEGWQYAWNVRSPLYKGY